MYYSFVVVVVFQENITPQNVATVSENLKKIIGNATFENTVDIVTVTSLVTKIAHSLNGFRRNETEVHTF